MSHARYARQIALDAIGQSGQRKISEATVLVVGCGALGSVSSELLARAGIGRLILVDRDVLEVQNLQRQTLYDEADVAARRPKADAAAHRLRAVNSEIVIDAVVEDVTAENIEEIALLADVIIDGTDNLETRYLLNDWCVKRARPWVYGGVVGTEGVVMAVKPGCGPCLRCVFPRPPGNGVLATCETAGVLNAAVMWVAALQVTKALQFVMSKDADSVDTALHSLNIWSANVRAVSARRDEECVCCARRQFEFLDARRGSSATVMCGRNAVQVTPSPRAPLDLRALLERLNSAGKATSNGSVVEFEIGSRRLIAFADGRVLVMGTTDPAEARSLVAKYVGS